MKASDLRVRNLARILQTVAHSRHGISRASIARHIGVTRSTVSKLVDELVAAHLLEESEPVQGKMGRPSIPLTLGTHSLLGIGIEFRADCIVGVGRDLVGSLTSEFVYAIDARQATADHIAAGVAELVNDVCLDAAVRWDVDDDWLRSSRVVDVHLAIPGRMSSDGSTVLSAPALGWTRFPLMPALRSVLPGISLTPQNDSQLHALAELDGRQHESFIYVRGGTGIGGALVLDGRLYTGIRDWAGEIGHTSVYPGGALCACGRHGCMEAYLSQAALRARTFTPGSRPFPEVIERLNADPSVYLEDVCVPLGVAISNALNLVDVSTVILSGYLGLLDSRYLKRLGEVVSVGALGAEETPPTIAIARDLDIYSVQGAARAAIDSVLQKPGEWVAAVPLR